VPWICLVDSVGPKSIDGRKLWLCIPLTLTIVIVIAVKGVVLLVRILRKNDEEKVERLGLGLCWLKTARRCCK